MDSVELSVGSLPNLPIRSAEDIHKETATIDLSGTGNVHYNTRKQKRPSVDCEIGNCLIQNMGCHGLTTAVEPLPTIHQSSFEGTNLCSPNSSQSVSSTIQQQLQQNSVETEIKRESMSSNAGTSSVCRLINVVRSTPSHLGPVYSRRLLCRNLAALCLGHAMVTAGFIPLFALQGSVSSWWWPLEFEDEKTPDSSLEINPNVGSIFLASLFAVSSLSAMLAPGVIFKIGVNLSLIISYIGAFVFFAAHLYPKAYILIPGYLCLALMLGILVSSRTSFLIILASKFSFVLSEEEEEEVEYIKRITRKELVVQRLSRVLQFAQDVGLVVGNLLTSLILNYTMTSVKDIEDSNFVLNSIFKGRKNNDRICGQMPCLLLVHDSSNHEVEYSDYAYINLGNGNNTESNKKYVLPCRTTTVLASVFLGCTVAGIALSCAFMDRLKNSSRQKYYRSANTHLQEVFKDTRLQLAAPLSFFIGIEQGFMYSDFTKSYVVCAVGIKTVSMVFVSLGTLQGLSGLTLSMLLPHIQRYIVIVMGFIFQSSLLLVLYLWKPTDDDSALLFVIAAAWGVCNSIWELLNFSVVASDFQDKPEASMAQIYFFRYLGLAFAFGLHSLLCNRVKLYGIAICMVVAVIPYTLLETRLEDQRKINAQLAEL